MLILILKIYYLKSRYHMIYYSICYPGITSIRCESKLTTWKKLKDPLERKGYENNKKINKNEKTSKKKTGVTTQKESRLGFQEK